MSSSHKLAIKVVSYGSFLLLVILVLTKMKTFAVWSQITDIYNYPDAAKTSPYRAKMLVSQEILVQRGKFKKVGFHDANKIGQETTGDYLRRKPKVDSNAPTRLLFAINVHNIRKYILMPTMVIGDRYKISIHRVFSFQVLALILILFGIISNILKSLGVGEERYLILFFFSSISLLMNGRLLFAFLSMTLLLHLFFKLAGEKRFILFFILSLLVFFFSNISTGIAAIIYALAISLTLLLSWTKKINKMNVAALTLAAAIFFPLFIAGIQKNLAFFGGGLSGFYGMLSHGYGQKLAPYFAFLLLGTILLVSILYYFRNKVLPFFLTYKIEVMGILFGLLGGNFGYSTMTIGLIPGAILILRLFNLYILQRRSLSNQ